MLKSQSFMRWPQNITSLLILVVLFALPIGLWAQMNWAQVATPSTIGITPHTMDAADGIVLVGGNGLAISTDKGGTWRNITPNISVNPNFVGIAIYDRNIFAVQSGTNGIYITYDQGMTWRPLLYSSPVVPAFPLLFFEDDPGKILCTTNGAFIYTRDGGNNFTSTTTNLNPYQFKLAADGTVRLFSRTDFDVRTASSSDTGKTWVESTILPYKDCFSIIADPANPNVHCLINEDFYLQQHVCMIFRTSDNGSTWDTTLTHALTYLAGSSDRGCTDYFVGTVSDGILRSTDQGRTWHGIGGPSVLPDYRNLVAADDSLLFAIDLNHALWATRPVSNTWKIRLRNNLFFSNTEKVACDSLRTGRLIVYPGCSNTAIQRADIVGPDAQDYRFLDSVDATFPDTILVEYHVSRIGTTSASLKVILTDGSEHLFDLSTTTVAPEVTFSPQVLMEDSLNFCQTLSDTLSLQSPCPMSLSSLQLTGSDSASFIVAGSGNKSLPKDSSIIVICVPKRLGQLDGQLWITTQYGSKYLIPLRPIVKRVPLAVVYDTIWARDSLWQCQNSRDTIRLRSICSLDSIRISLTDSSDYHLLSKQIISLPQDSVVIVEYTSSGKTDIASYLTFRSPVLDSVNVPLRRSFKRAPVVFKYQPKILNDTFSFCKEITDTLIFTSFCPHTGSNIHFEGPDAARFKIIGKATFQLPSDSLLVISCSTDQPGQLNADLVFQTEDGFITRFRLSPVFVTTAFRFKPSALFVGDSIGACAGGFDTLRIHADCPLKVKSLSITGIDASSFALISSTPLQLPGDSLIVVQCLAGPKGRRLAALRIQLEDGRTWNISLSALIVDAPLKIAPAALFFKDTISRCSFAFDTVRLLAPCPLDLKNIVIQGPDAALFKIEGPSPSYLPRDSLIVVRCTPNRTGAMLAHLSIEAADGRMWNIPLSPTGVESKLELSRTILFANDTILYCSSALDSVALSADCPLTVSSIKIGGKDAGAFFVVGSASRVLPGDSVIVVVCIPDKQGQLDAMLTITSGDGRNWDIPLSLVAREAPLQLSKNSLFGGRSISICSAASDTLKFSSSCPTDIQNIYFSGSDAASFSASFSQASIPNDSMLVVTCQPSHVGQHDAVMHILSSGGKILDVSLSVFAEVSMLALSDNALFVQDSFTVCDIRRDTLYLRASCPYNISNLTIAGPDQSFFTILGKASLSLPEDSIVIIDCRPGRSGQLDATLTSKDFTVSLRPYIIDKAVVSLAAISEVKTDTLGGDIIVPISINQTLGKGVIEFSIRYDESRLEYIGVFDKNNADKTSLHTAGVSRIVSEVEGTTVLLAQYRYFPQGTDCTEILIDSITTAGGQTSCLTTLSGSTAVMVCSDGFCGRDAITQFLHYGGGINLAVTPNPTQGNIVLHSDRTLADAYIELVDAYGVVQKTLSSTQLTPAGLHIDMSGLPSGIYEVRVNNGLYHGSARIALTK